MACICMCFETLRIRETVFCDRREVGGQTKSAANSRRRWCQLQVYAWVPGDWWMVVVVSCLKSKLFSHSSLIQFQRQVRAVGLKNNHIQDEKQCRKRTHSKSLRIFPWTRSTTLIKYTCLSSIATEDAQGKLSSPDQSVVVRVVCNVTQQHRISFLFSSRWIEWILS